jgi:hypothetical protein
MVVGVYRIESWPGHPVRKPADTPSVGVTVLSSVVSAAAHADALVHGEAVRDPAETEARFDGYGPAA